MPHDDSEQRGFATRAIRTGHTPTAEQEHSEPIFATSSYTYESAAQAAARFSGEEPGNIYSRFTNPTVRAFEQRLAALEQGEHCVATASGMAAILTVCMSLLKAGDHVIASRRVSWNRWANSPSFDKLRSSELGVEPQAAPRLLRHLSASGAFHDATVSCFPLVPQCHTA